ncbi:signal peptidase II [Microvirga sp. SYSU G3D207]|uniref:Lipoprotein signal peptidase n=1 Tax=Microvirga arsenatis TaxID=2692265 RepID=A0ABW9Z0T2_9HYPH|nr:signal peptidase II [Microvirga arsenatis]NBJ26264.1 signal peptidase II [Microvirga arsenatis]
MDEPGAPLSETGAASQAGPRRSRAPGRARSAGGAKARTARSGLSAASLLGFSAALITLVLDQATKLYTLFVFDLPVKEPVEFAPFINLIVVWNRGISYGLFQQSSDLGRWALIVISILAAIGLSVWIRRTSAKLLAASLGLIVGGALGNVIDRLAYGAVFDFIQFHIGSWSWYVFNVADAAIVAGVVGLLYDSFVLEGRRAR